MLPCDDVDGLLKDLGEFIAYFSMVFRGPGGPTVHWTGGVGFTSGDVTLTLHADDAFHEVWTENDKEESVRDFTALPLAGKCVWFDLLSGMLDEEDGYEHYQQWIHRPPSTDIGISQEKRKGQHLYVKSSPHITYPIDPADADANAEIAHIMAASYKEIWEAASRKFTEEQLQSFGPLPKITEHRVNKEIPEPQTRKGKHGRDTPDVLTHPDTGALLTELGEYLGSMGAILTGIQQRGGGAGFARAGIGPAGTVVCNSPQIPELLRVHKDHVVLLRKVQGDLLPGPSFSGFDVAGRYSLIHYGDRLRTSVQAPSILDSLYEEGRDARSTVEDSGPYAVRVADKENPERYLIVHPKEATLASQLLHRDYKDILSLLFAGLPDSLSHDKKVVTPWGEY